MSKIRLPNVITIGIACILVLSKPLYADVWVIGTHQIAKISSDGKKLVSINSVFSRGFNCFIGIKDVIGVNQLNGSVWVSDCNNNRVFKLNSDGEPQFKIDLFSPLAIGINPIDGSVWTSIIKNETGFPGAVIKLDPNTGQELVRVSGFSGLISSISVESSGNIWISDRDNDEVVLLFGTDDELNGYDTSASSGIHHERFSGFSEPLQIDISPEDDPQGPGNIWVADRNNLEIVKLSRDGTELVRKNPTDFFEVGSVSVNSRDGSVWISERERIAKLSSIGDELINLSYGPNLPGAIAIDMTDEAAWLSIAISPQDFALLKLDPNGLEMIRIEGFKNIASLATIPNPNTTNIDIDIKPRSKRNKINLRSHKRLWVAVLANAETHFDPQQINISTVRFGPNGAKVIHSKVRDINKDGLPDLLLRFKVHKTGLTCGSTKATLTGMTIEEQDILGRDSIQITNCKKKRYALRNAWTENQHK